MKDSKRLCLFAFPLQFGFLYHFFSDFLRKACISSFFFLRKSHVLLSVNCLLTYFSKLDLGSGKLRKVMFFSRLRVHLVPPATASTILLAGL